MSDRFGTMSVFSAYVLHNRPYKETSALVDFFTPEGRIRAVLRRARGKNGSLVRSFMPLEGVFQGRSELKNVIRLESTGIPLLMTGKALFSGLYLNELLIRLLPLEDAHPLLFEHYALTLQAMAEGRPLEPLLRAFEWFLLEQLGYGFALDLDFQGQPVSSGGLYRWQADHGLVGVEQLQPGVFHGSDLLAMAQADWSVPGALAAAKRLMRQLLAPHLRGRPLASRELFMTLKEPAGD